MTTENPEIAEVDEAEPVEAEIVDAETEAPTAAVEIAAPPPAPPVGMTENLPVVPEATELTRLAQMAQAFATAGAVPSNLRGKPHDVFLVLVTARELGIGLTAAMREVHIVEGTPTLSPKLKLGIVHRHGLGQVWPDPANDDHEATWHTIPANVPGGHTYSVTFTWEDAQQAGLAGRSCTPGAHQMTKTDRNGRAACGCKPPWRMYPRRMLSARALGYTMMDYYSEVGTGLYSPEEMGAIVDEDGTPTTLDGVTPLQGLEPRRSAAQRSAAGDVAAEAETLDALNRSLAAIKAHAPDAAAEAMDWWKDRNLPPLRSLTARQARTVEARVASIVDREPRVAEALQAPSEAQEVGAGGDPPEGDPPDPENGRDTENTGIEDDDPPPGSVTMIAPEGDGAPFLTDEELAERAERAVAPELVARMVQALPEAFDGVDAALEAIDQGAAAMNRDDLPEFPWDNDAAVGAVVDALLSTGEGEAEGDPE